MFTAELIRRGIAPGYLLRRQDQLFKTVFVRLIMSGRYSEILESIEADYNEEIRSRAEARRYFSLINPPLAAEGIQEIERDRKQDA